MYAPPAPVDGLNPREFDAPEQAASDISRDARSGSKTTGRHRAAIEGAADIPVERFILLTPNDTQTVRAPNNP